MGKLLRIYYLFWKQEVCKQLMYRPLMAMFSYVAHVAWIAASYVFLVVVSADLSSQIQKELLLFLSFFHFVKGLFWIYCSQSSGFLAGSAFREGKIDYFLIRPIPSQWAVSSFKPNIFAATDFFIGLGSFLYFSSLLGLINPLFLSIFFLCGLLSTVLLYTVWFSYLTLFVPSGEASAAHNLMNLLWIFGQYPNNLYSGLAKVISTIVFPTVIITTLPMNILLQRSPIGSIAFLAGAAGVGLLVCSFLWNRMLRFYTSAN